MCFKTKWCIVVITILVIGENIAGIVVCTNADDGSAVEAAQETVQTWKMFDV